MSEEFKQQQKEKAFNGESSILSFNLSDDIKLIWECQSCQTIISLFGYDAPKSCGCGKSKFKKLGWEYSEERLKEAGEKFKNPNLLQEIHQEISKTHIGDDNLKMTTFLTATSGLLKNQKLRMSIAITGNSSEGKGNLIKTALKHQPKDAQIFVTSATQSSIEDDIGDKRQIGFSEVNANRENGANKFLTEVIKQKTEGGTSAIKKDLRDGMKSTRHEIGEQASVLYGTTETQSDEEMQTRFIQGTIQTDAKRIERVNNNTFETFSDLDKLLSDRIERDSWIRVGLTYFLTKDEQPETILPYAKYLMEKINDKPIFDNTNPRSQRDIKRILALTCAMTYLFQEQRQKVEHKEQVVLVSEPQDFINTLLIAGEFFNQSYTGLDKRLSNILTIMQEIGGEWVARDLIQEKMDIKRKITIKSYCETLSREGLIEGISGRELNEQVGLKIYNGNKIYFKRVQNGAKKPLIRVQINELKQFLEEKTGKPIDPFNILSLSSINDKNDEEKGAISKGRFTQPETENQENSSTLEQNDPFLLTPFTEEDFDG